MAKYNKVLNILKVYFIITIGSAIAAIAINIFMVPYKIAPGGLSGLSTILYYLSDEKFPVGITMLVINIPLFILGYKFIGKNFFIRTVYGTIILSVLIDISEPFTAAFADKILSNIDSATNSPDIFLYSVIGGFLMGVGLGIVFRMDATTGGTELAAQLLKRSFKNLTIGQILLILDGIIIALAIITFNSILIGLYSLVSLYITTKVIDTMIEGVGYSRALLIISEYSDDISKAILITLDRGITELKGKGMYTGNDKNVLLCVVDRTQVQLLKDIVHDIDPNAFMILADVREVLGEGFQSHGK